MESKPTGGLRHLVPFWPSLPTQAHSYIALRPFDRGPTKKRLICSAGHFTTFPLICKKKKKGGLGLAVYMHAYIPPPTTCLPFPRTQSDAVLLLHDSVHIHSIPVTPHGEVLLWVQRFVRAAQDGEMHIRQAAADRGVVWILPCTRAKPDIEEHSRT